MSVVIARRHSFLWELQSTSKDRRIAMHVDVQTHRERENTVSSIKTDTIYLQYRLVRQLFGMH